ncbi:MAG: hypothetical protein R6X20_11180 [Phycisphaerae bacterium]
MTPSKWIMTLGAALALLAAPARAAGPDRAQPYLKAARTFADAVLEHGRDGYGPERTPLFVDGLHAETLEPVRWKKDGESWVLSNVASQQPLLRLLDGLAAVTGEPRYRKAAEAAARCTLERLRTPNGLLYWGGHAAWDLATEKPVGQYGFRIHEVKGHRPYYRLFWRVDARRAAQLMNMVWAGHVLDWKRLDYNRHADTQKEYPAGWDHPFTEDLQVPFPAKGGNLSFVNVTPPLLHSSVMAAVLGDDAGALRWSRRLVRRWQQGRHPKTGLCGGQLSYREHDRAQDALGHVHPDINEAKIVASYHQTCRYHRLPLAQMQDGLALVAAGGERAAVGRDLIRLAAEDLAVYARECYDAETGTFVACMIDGTPLEWKKARSGYYVPESFRPRRADGFLLWGYALAWRLTGDEVHWTMVRRIARERGLGDVGSPDGDGRRLDRDTGWRNWESIYTLLDLHAGTGDRAFLDLAARIGDNLLATQARTGLFPRKGRAWARTGDEVPLALAHLAAALRGKRDAMPAPAYDNRFFHAEFHGDLKEHQKKRRDRRTYDSRVFYGG